MIFEELVKPALDSLTKLVSEFHMSPDDKAKAQQAIVDAAAKAQQAAQDYDVQLNAIAGQNIRAETQSDDRFVSRSRPTVIYAGAAFFVWNWGLVPVLGLHWHLQPANVPEAFWWTWGTIVTGYVFSRSTEKIAAIPGDSAVSVAGGLLRVGNKSQV